MLVPEAAMNKDSRSVFRQNDVRLSWQIFPMEPKSIVKFGQRFADNQLGVGVAGSDSRHVPTPALY